MLEPHSAYQSFFHTASPAASCRVISYIGIGNARVHIFFNKPMQLQFLLHRISHRKLPWINYFHSAALSETSASNEIVSVIESVNPMEPELDAMVPFLSPADVTSVIQDPPNPQLGFRFFIWASRYKRFRTWESRETILRMLVEEKGTDLYCQVLEEMKRSWKKLQVPAEAFLVLIQAYERKGMGEKAVEAFGLMGEFDCKPDVFTYNAFLQILLRRGVSLLAVAVYHQMVNLNCIPNRTTFAILIGGLFDCGETKTALQVFDIMEEKGILPDKVVYTMVISALCQAGSFDDAYRLLDKMRSRGCEPDTATYNSLLTGYCKFGRIDEALACLRSFRQEGYVPDACGYSCLIDGLIKAKRYVEAHTWYREMISNRVSPDVVLYTIWIKGLLDGGKVSKALKLLNEMPKRGAVPDVQCYNVVIKGLCDIGLLNVAQALSLKITKHGYLPSVYTHTILINRMSKNGMTEEAERMVDYMGKVGCHPSVVTFNAVIDGLCRSGKLQEALRKKDMRNDLLSMQVLGLRSDSLKKIEESYEPGLILKVYNTLLQLDRKVVPDITTYNILIKYCCLGGNIDEAYKLLNELPLRGLSPDSVTYGTLINGLLRLGREKKADQVFEQMVKSGCIPSTAVYKSLMTWACRRKNVTSAFRFWLKYLKSVAARESDGIEAIEELVEKGKTVVAIQSLLEMDRRVNDFQLAPYMIWLIGLCQSGRVEEASKVFSVLDTCKVVITPTSCVSLIQGLCIQGKLDLAVNVFDYTIKRGFLLRPRVCNQLLKSLLRSKDASNDVAANLLRRMEAHGYNLNKYLHRTTKFLLREQ
ncbi:Pentatricopeptide repeat-containing protein At1g79540 [Linum perenne]